MNKLSHTMPDPFEPFQGGHRRARTWKFIAAAQVVVIVFLAVLVALVSARRPEVINQPCGEPAQLLRAEKDPPITQDNARLFFLQMARLRYGWDSMTLMRDLDEYIGLCHGEQRQFEREYLTAMVAPDPEMPNDKVQRRQLWVTSQIKNTLLLPKLNHVDCKMESNKSWTCQMTATIETQRLFPPFHQAPKHQRSRFIASLLAVDRTIDTPAGLIVGILRSLPEQEKDS